MRSRTSRGVPEWSGGEDLYMGSPVLATGRVSGVTGNVPGPPGGATSPGGPYGLYVEGNQPLGGMGASPLGPMRLGLGGTLRGASPLAWGQAPSPWPPPPL